MEEKKLWKRSMKKKRDDEKWKKKKTSLYIFNYTIIFFHVACHVDIDRSKLAERTKNANELNLKEGVKIATFWNLKGKNAL